MRTYCCQREDVSSHLHELKPRQDTCSNSDSMLNI